MWHEERSPLRDLLITVEMLLLSIELRFASTLRFCVKVRFGFVSLLFSSYSEAKKVHTNVETLLRYNHYAEATEIRGRRIIHKRTCT